MSDLHLSPKIAAVIATSNRFHMLAERSLPSVSAQTRLPDVLVVVDDSTLPARPANAVLVNSLVLSGCEVVYLENERSTGASGAWNTALDFLTGKVDEPYQIFVAILDDDDSWDADYLERCAAAVQNQQLDMVAAGLRRFESGRNQPLLSEAPPSLRAEDFMVSNPGIQGSNLFVRLPVLLAAGGFDEGLRSTTDRDLCIRIADLGTVRYSHLPIVLVNHFADSDRVRLSTCGSTAKIEGLTSFWRKYAGRMTDEQRRAFLDRSAALFGWRPPGDNVVGLSHHAPPKKALVLGLIADHDRPDELLEVIHHLAGWKDDTLVGLDVVLLERGSPGHRPALIDEATKRLRDCGVGCFCVSLKDLDEFNTGKLSSDAVLYMEQPTGDSCRQLLGIYSGRVAADRVGTEVWLVVGSERNGCAPDGMKAQDVLRWLHATQADSKQLATLSSNPIVSGALNEWLQRERVTTAEHRVKRRFSLEHVRLLGCGSEAVVFTDERTVYKCIDYWKTRIPQPQLDFLRGQIGQWEGKPGLYTLRSVEEDGPWTVLTYDYETSTPYNGGQEVDLIRLLCSCCEAGIVCNNIHPKNLVVTPSGTKLIDYGSDIRPWTPLGFEHMARKAFLTCRHAAQPDLPSLMRRAIQGDSLPEMTDYHDFRAIVDEASNRVGFHHGAKDDFGEAPEHPPLRLYVGVITSDPTMLAPLLSGLLSIQASESVQTLGVLILDNGSSSNELDAVVHRNRNRCLKIAVIDEAQQHQDIAAGCFGSALRSRPQGQVGIAMARTMLQRYLGAVLAADTDSFGWVLDDDMRVDDRAHAYLRWLPAFRDQGVDAIIGACEGSSPNPPLNGLRVQLVDLLHNLHWLRRMPDDMLLPNRASENAELRACYPDYYYDLSRKHTGHLETPHWLEPVTHGETVGEAYRRLLNGAIGLLNGDPLTRPIIVTPSPDPLNAAKDSVNRGGCTFILNHRTLSATPNLITNIDGREARRSDMVWAIINRYYRHMSIKAVAFPIHHVGRINAAPSLNTEKVRGELIGSTLYAGLTEFLRARPNHDLAFSPEESDEVCNLAELHLARRWRQLEQSFHRIAGLREALCAVASPGELQGLLECLKAWFTPKNFDQLRAGMKVHDRKEVRRFLTSLQQAADDYAATTVNIDFIETQLWGGNATSKGAQQ